MKTNRKVARIGMDVHRKFSKVTARDEQGKILWRQRLEHEDRHALRQRLADWPKGTPVILEGTFGWGWLCDELLAAELDPHLASSRKVAAWRCARGIAKCDRTDADLLSELWTEPNRWWEVWLAPQQVQDQREWLRYRMSCVAMQTRLKNQIHAVLHRHGIVHGYTDLFGCEGRRFLNLLVAPNDATLRESGRATLKGHLQSLDHARRQIARLTREFCRQLRKEPLGERLRSIPGIAWILAYTIMAEIGCIERFRSDKHLASYSLLVPLANETGDPDDEYPKGRHVGFAGRRTLKWAFIEAAHAAVRHGGRFRKIYDRRTDGGRKDRNRGYIAVAHELCRLVYVVWSKEIKYMETPPARPGQQSNRKRSKRMKSKSRPGTGQPTDPMAVAAV